MKTKKIHLITLLVFTFIFNKTTAAPNLFFRGTIIDPPPCKINNDQKIDVDFGDKLGVNKIDGNNYRKKINYIIECSIEDFSSSLLLTVTGNVMNNDYSAVQSSTPGLGIRLIENNRRLRIGQGLVINSANPPLLEAVPVADAGIKLLEGDFLASASLLVEYY